MQTAVVSGRVNAEVKMRADRIIKKNDLTVAEVIKRVWTEIASSGKLPDVVCSESTESKGTRQFDEFEAFVSSLPSASSEFAEMTEIQMKEMLGGRRA